MKFLGIVGSMRKQGNTFKLVSAVLEGAKSRNPDISYDILQISELNIGPCWACYDSCSKESYRCIVEDDFQAVLKKMEEAQALVVGSPLYFPFPSRLVALAERLACLAYFFEERGFKTREPLEDKPCGLVAATGGSDPMPVLQYLSNWALSLKMKPITVKFYPYFGVAAVGRLEEDGNKPLEKALALGKLLAEAVS
jgi:multimeric flavodoxin WrbA